MPPLTEDQFYYIHYTRTGEGDPMLLLHGLASSHFDWDMLSPALVAAGYQVIAPDLPGHGDSYKPHQRELYHVENVFDTFSEWLDSFEIDAPLTLVGHSLGGYLAIEFALRHPERVKALILLAPLYTPAQIPWFLRLGFREEAINALAANHVPGWLYSLMADLSSFTLIEGQRLGYGLPKTTRSQTARDYQRVAPAAFHLPFTARNLAPYLDRVSAPTLLIYGQRDRTLNPRSFPPMAERLPNARVLALPAGHALHQTHSARVASEIIDFLKSTDRESSR